MNLEELRKRIDETDDRILKDFSERMGIAAEIAKFKTDNNRPVADRRREREKTLSIINKTPDEFRDYTPILYSILFELSRSYQQRLVGYDTELTEKIKNAIENTDRLFPKNAYVACQGVEGAFSQTAAEKLFKHPDIMYFSNFEAVFKAIEQGLCRYGVIPVENSTAGSVNSVYDLMMEHKFYIVNSIRLKVDHNLLAKPGVKLSDIREIYSHEQAISQCAGFLRKMEGIKIIPVDNTAAAARMVAESKDSGIAAIASRSCENYYGLNCLSENIQDKDNNYTRFICISKELEIYPGADRTSLMVILQHEAGALYKLLSRFYALDINLNKLESRPLPDREFEFMFYFDLDTPVYSTALLELLGELPGAVEKFIYLGSYKEVI